MVPGCAAGARRGAGRGTASAIRSRISTPDLGVDPELGVGQCWRSGAAAAAARAPGQLGGQGGVEGRCACGGGVARPARGAGHGPGRRRSGSAWPTPPRIRSSPATSIMAGGEQLAQVVAGVGVGQPQLAGDRRRRSARRRSAATGSAAAPDAPGRAARPSRGPGGHLTPKDMLGSLRRVRTTVKRFFGGSPSDANRA